MTGDTTDNYKGCPGIGAVKAKALFEKSGANWNTVVEAFRKAGLTEEDALVQARVAYILRGWDYNPKSREIKLWLPKEG
jgi:DNA polymerase-1